MIDLQTQSETARLPDTRKLTPEQLVAENTAAELFMLLTQQGLDWTGTGVKTSFGDQRVTPDRMSEVLAGVLSSASGRTVTLQEAAAVIDRIRSVSPNLLTVHRDPTFPKGSPDQESYIKFGNIRGPRYTELLTKMPRVTPGQDSGIVRAPFLQNLARDFVTNAQPKPKSP
jgi:hypothetical protein